MPPIVGTDRNYTTQKVLQSVFDNNGFLNIRLVNASGSAVLEVPHHGIGTINQPFLYAISEGLLPLHEPFRKSGFNPDIDNQLEDVWDGGGVYTFPDVPMQMEVVSSSTNDDIDGVGARRVEVHYLDDKYERHEEIIELDGTTPVPTVATNILRINDFHLVEVGSSGSLAGANGNIDIRHLDNLPTYGRIQAGTNACLSCITTVPASSSLYISSWEFDVGAAQANHFTQGRLQTTVNNIDEVLPGVFVTQVVTIATDQATTHTFDTPIKVPGKADVKVSAISDGGTANVNVASTLYGWYAINH